MTRWRPALAVLAALGCAQYGAPPGGERDQAPPRVIETQPPPFAVVPELRGPVVIRFDERLSERGAENAILVSPQTGDVDIERDGDALRVAIEGGWQPGQVYRIVVLPELRDLFGNQRREASELVFSTGPPIPPTALAGLVSERITGEPPQNAVVRAMRPDSTVYVTPVATDGFYALLNLPNGSYEVVGFTDANRNWRVDPNELRSVAHTVTLADDTIPMDLAVLPVDTSAALIVGARQDGDAIRVQLDDHVDAAGLESSTAQVFTLPDSTPLALQAEVLTPAEYTRTLPPDTTVAADTLATDSAAAADTAAARPPQLVDTTRAEPLPTREVVVLPATPLAAGSYLVEVQGIVNINGIAGGGGRAPVTITPPPPPDTTSLPVDTTSARPDASVPPPATAAAPRRR